MNRICAHRTKVQVSIKQNKLDTPSKKQSKMNRHMYTMYKALPPLIFACKYGTLDEVRALLADPANDPTESDEHSAILAVMDGDRADILKLLLADGRANPMFASGLPLTMAIQRNSVACAHALLDDPRVDPSVNENYAIICAARGNQLEIAKRLLTYPAVDPSVSDNNPILMASYHDYYEMAKLLMKDSRVNPAANNNAAVRTAVYWGHEAIMMLMLYDPRVDPSANDNELIRLAVKQDEPDIIRRLLLWPSVLEGNLPLEEMEGAEYVASMQKEARKIALLTRPHLVATDD